jgi:acyl carrier protein
MLEASEVHSIVVEVLSEVLKTPLDIGSTESLVDYGLTSFESVTLVLPLEDRFETSFPDTALLLQNILTVDRIIHRRATGERE